MSAAGSERERTDERGRFVRWLRDVVVIMVVAVLISLGLKTFVVRAFFIPSGSMENTLMVGDRILVNEFIPRFAAVERGDVVVFEDPGGWLPDEPVEAASNPISSVLEFIGLAPTDSDNHLIKRVVGVAGDVVVCCTDEGQVSVNGTPLDEPYVVKPDAAADSVPTRFEVTVPDGHLWVLGDNRYRSEDSAAHYAEGSAGGGFVPVDDVVGKAFVITWPTSRWSWLGDYPDVFLGTDPASGQRG